MNNRGSITWHVSQRVQLPVRDAADTLDQLVRRRSLQRLFEPPHATLGRPLLTIPPHPAVARKLCGQLHLGRWARSLPVDVELVAWSHRTSELGLRPSSRIPTLGCADRYFTAAVEVLEILGAEVAVRARRVTERVAEPPSTPKSVRRFATVLFTDIVESTRTAASVGDDRWREILDVHDSIVADEIEQHRGRLVKQTGDGVLATFDGPAPTIHCARAISGRLQPVGVSVRAGIHAGEIDLRGSDIGGITVNIAARVTDHAGPNEVVVSSTVRDLVAGSNITFEDRGVHELQGTADDLQLLAVAGL